jgi:hypothetical protein
MNDVREFSVPTAQLSCLIGNLFAELEPPCAEPDEPETLTLCGKAPSGREAMLFVYQEHCLFVGDPEDLDAARNGRCPDRRCGRG